jgi:hypothetical protein
MRHPLPCSIAWCLCPSLPAPPIYTHATRQVLESLVIALVDLSPLLLPHLVADVGTPLGRLVDLVGEVTAAMQEQVGGVCGGDS